MRVWCGLFAFASLCLAPVAANAVETGSAQEGQVLARQVCAECHAVERGDAFSPVFPAPTFEVIAETPGMTATALSVVLRTPHATMPDLMLTSEQIGNLTAYILSLKDGQ